jgi:hypothetical protein
VTSGQDAEAAGGSRLLSWLADNADAAIGLTIAVLASVLGILDLVPAQVVTNVTVLTLATLAFVMLRDRHRAETSARQIRKSVGDAHTEVQELFNRSAKALERMPQADQLAQWQDTVSRLRESLAHAALVQVVPGDEVGQVHAQARIETRRWVFKGGTGTYLRAVTLPECVNSARKGHRTITVQFEIIDPLNRELCDEYARFRASLTPGPDHSGEMWTLDRTRKEAFATILAACWYRQNYTLLDVAGGLSSVMTTFRTDMSSSHLIITQESGSSPALVVEAGKPHFGAYEQELQSSFKQARLVEFSLARDVPLSGEPTVDEARRLFAKLGLSLPSTFTDQDVTHIIGKALRPSNPYR